MILMGIGHRRSFVKLTTLRHMREEEECEGSAARQSRCPVISISKTFWRYQTTQP